MTEASASARAADPRPARTREALYEAVRELSASSGGTDEKSFTVNSLVRQAGVSRSAFYAQFSDLDDLMVALLIDTFREIGAADLTGRHDTSSASPRDLARASLTALGEHFEQRRAFYTASLGWNVSVRVHQAIVGAFAAQVRETMLAIDDVPSEVDVADTSAYIGGGLVTVMTAWVSSTDPAPVPDLVERLLALLPPWLTSGVRGEGRRA